MRNRIMNSPGVRAAALAAGLAQELGLPPGNYWEPAITRMAEQRLQAGDSLEDIEEAFRLQWDMPAKESKANVG